MNPIRIGNHYAVHYGSGAQPCVVISTTQTPGLVKIVLERNPGLTIDVISESSLVAGPFITGGECVARCKELNLAADGH